MATPERDTVYTRDGERTVYTRESNGTGWFVGIIVALALLAIGYLVFSANSGPTTTVDTTTTPAIESTTPPAMDTQSTVPMTEAPAPATDAAPMAPADTPAGNTNTTETVAPPAAPGV